jgi:hypothetical protein
MFYDPILSIGIYTHWGRGNNKIEIFFLKIYIYIYTIQMDLWMSL